MKKDLRLNQELLFLQDRRQFQLKDLMTEFNISGSLSNGVEG